MAMFKDDSADDVTCCYLQLEERLRINRGERPSSTRYAMSGKDMKQLCNQQRQKHILDEQSSSSSSLDMHNDPSIPGPSSAYSLQNKKRQNGDKPIDQFVNPKRTCLDDAFQKSPNWSDCRKVNTNGDIPYSRKIMDFSTEPPNLTARSLLPGNTYEDHANDLSDFSDLDGWPVFDNKQAVHKELPKHPALFEIAPSGSKGVQFVDSTSEDDSRTRQMGALKGGRQSPDPTSNKMVLRRKIKRVLDSDDSDSDEWQVGYRRPRPVMFSSSDSDDSEKRSKDKPSGIVSKKSANLSFSSGDSQKSGQDHSCYRDRTARSFFESVVDAPSVPPRSSYRTRSPSYRSYKTRGSNRMNGQTASTFNTIGDSLTIPERQMMQPSMPHRRTLRSSQDVDSNLTSRAKLIADFGLIDPINNGDVASSSRLPSEFVPFFPHQGLESHSKLSPQSKLSRGSSSRKLPDPATRRRAVGRAHTLKDRSNLAVRHPDIFDAEDSSEVEFFTANSYSDNESNTESLNRRTGPLVRRPVYKKQEVRSDPSINVGSSEDEISVVFSSGPQTRSPLSRTGESRRRTSRTLGRRYSRGSRRSLPQTQAVSLSPDPVEQVRQVEEDERFARVLQAQFDAEVDPTYMPRPHGSPNPFQMNIREATSSDEDTSSLDVEEMLFSGNAERPQPPPFTFPVTPHFQMFSPMSFPRRSNAARRFDVRINLNTALNGSTRLRPRLPERYDGFGVLHHPWLEGITPFEDNSYETFLGLIEMNGDVTRGLQKSQINRLPTRKYATINSASSSGATELPHKRAELNKECQVCLNDYVNGDVLRILPCFHEFHTPCIDPWLKINHTCPVCRVVVDLDE